MSTAIASRPAEGQLSCALILVFGQFGCLVGVEDLCPDCLGMAERLETRGMFCKLVMPEIAGTHPGGEHQIIERDLPAAADRAGNIE
jgi:hypothetical protein